ncbi:MAG: isoprenyl transferase [Planctomycetota bacterium]
MSDAKGTSRPRHIAIIMDGNGRWAAQRGLPRIAGHQHAITSVRDVTEYCARDPVIEQLTLYAFSAENWKRPKREIDALMMVLTRFLAQERAAMQEAGVRLELIGQMRGLPRELLDTARETQRLTRRNRKLLLCLAVNYGSRAEIASAARRIARKVQRGALDAAEIDERCLSRHLYTAGMSDPDLMIRTAGEKRLSNFLLWQLWYSEFYFTPTLWPDFRREHLEKAIASFRRRKRKFGGL